MAVEFSARARAEVGGVDTSVCWIDHFSTFSRAKRNGPGNAPRALFLALPRFDRSIDPTLVVIGNKTGELEIFSNEIEVQGESGPWRLFSTQSWKDGEPQIVRAKEIPTVPGNTEYLSPFLKDGHLVYEGIRVFDVNTMGSNYLKIIAERFEDSKNDRLHLTYHPSLPRTKAINVGSFERLPENSRWALVTPPV